ARKPRAHHHGSGATGLERGACGPPSHPITGGDAEQAGCEARPVRLALACLLLMGCGSAAAPAAGPEAEPDAAGPRCEPASLPEPLVCNGHEALCDRPFDAVAYPTTHNAMSNAEERWIAPNQTFGMWRQLEDGVRGLMLDVYEDEGVTVLCHGYC